MNPEEIEKLLPEGGVAHQRLTISQALDWLFWRINYRNSTFNGTGARRIEDQVCVLAVKDYERALLSIQPKLVEPGAHYYVSRNAHMIKVIQGQTESSLLLTRIEGALSQLTHWRLNAGVTIGYPEDFFQQHIAGRSTRVQYELKNKAIFSE